MSRPRAGMDRIASPASPAAATSVVASTATDPVTSEAPGGGVRRDERCPRVRAAQHLGQRHPLRGHAGGLDEVEERRADPAEQHERDHPPRDGQHRAQPATTR